MQMVIGLLLGCVVLLTLLAFGAWLIVSMVNSARSSVDDGLLTGTHPQQRAWLEGQAIWAEWMHAVDDAMVRGASVEEPDLPELEPLADVALRAVRLANSTGQFDALRAQWPPLYDPFVNRLEIEGQSIDDLTIGADGTIMASVGQQAWWLGSDRVLPRAGVARFGTDSNQRYVAVSRPDGVAVHDGWDGAVVALCPWPHGGEGVPDGVPLQPVTPYDLVWHSFDVTPFPDGQRVLATSEDGAFILAPDGATRLLPRPAFIQRLHERAVKHDRTTVSINAERAHAALSSDGQRIVAGHAEDTTHYVLDPAGTEIGRVFSWYDATQATQFSADGAWVICHSGHFSGGATYAVPIEATADPRLDPQHDDRVVHWQGNRDAHHLLAVQDRMIVGDSGGRIACRRITGEPIWTIFVGSSITALALAPNERWLAVGSAAGIVTRFDLEPDGATDVRPREMRRWIFWQTEPRPLIW